MTEATMTKAAATLAEGAPAPDFAMPAHNGEIISLRGLAGKNIVLYFYPRDDTPGCTVEAKDFRDLADAFTEAGTVVIGVSRDSIASHCAFAEKFSLPFILASDEEGTVCEAYGVWVEKNMYGKKYMGIERATFLIDGAGTIRRIWRKVKVDGHAEAALAAVRSL